MKWKFWEVEQENQEPVTVNDAATSWDDSPANPELYPENSINYVPGNFNMGALGEYHDLYEHNWLARHIIDFPIEDSFGQWRTFPDKYKRAIEAEEEKLDYKEKLIDALTTCDVDGAVLIVMFVNNQPDMSKPLDLNAINKGDLLKIEVFDQLMVNKLEVEETNPLSDRYLLPKFYEIVGGTSNNKFHYSRCVELHGLELPRLKRRLIGNTPLHWGMSRLEPIKGQLKDYVESDNTISKILKRLALIFVKEPGVSHARTTKAFSKINKAIFNISRNIGLHGLLYADSKSEIGSISTSVSGLSDLMEIKQENVSGGGEIAVTRLFGKAKAGMSGDTNDGDIRNYQGFLLKYRNRKLKALKDLEKALIRSAIGRLPGDCVPEWGEISIQTETEKAEISLKLAMAKKAEKEANNVGKEDKEKGNESED